MRAEIKERIERVKSRTAISGYRDRYGLTPLSWKENRLAELADKVVEKNTNNDVSTVLSNTASRGLIEQSDYFEKDIANAENHNLYSIVRENDFVYNPRISTLAPYGPIHANELGISGIVSPLYTVFRLRNTEYVDYQFMKYYFASAQWFKYMYSVANYGARYDRMNITDDDFFKLPIFLPSYGEQHKIAEILTHCDKIIELKQQFLKEEQKRKKWLQKNLLNPDSGIRLPGFSGEWISGTIHSLARVKHGKSQHNIEYEDGKYPIMASGGEIGRTNTYLYNQPSVLIGRKGSISTPIYMDSPFWSIDTMFYTEITEGINPKYVYYLFCSINWWKYDASTGVPSLSASTIEKIKVSYPSSRDEQIGIANALSAIDNKVSLIEQEIIEWQQKKKALMQLLLTGLVRVNV